MRYLINTAALLLILLAVSCSKPGGDCLSSSGTVIFQTRGVTSFDSIHLNGYVNLILTQDSANSVVVEAGQKIIEGITTEVISNTLIIGNQNTCNWLRDYEKPLNVHVGVRHLSRLVYEASGNVSSTNKIITDNLVIDVIDGSGSIKLDVESHFGTFIARMGTVDISVTGRVIINDIFSAGYGPFHCENLTTDYQYITSESSNDCYVKCVKYLDAKIYSIGNIYYTGNPDTLYQTITGTGKLIPF